MNEVGTKKWIKHKRGPGEQGSPGPFTFVKNIVDFGQENINSVL